MLIHTSHVATLLAAVLIIKGASAQSLEQAEVRLSYGELRKLIDASSKQEQEPLTIPASLASNRIKLSIDSGNPAIDVEFRTLRFAQEMALVPLIGGDISLERHQPEQEALIIHAGMLCHAGDSAGSTPLQARFRVTTGVESFILKLPPCPATLLDTSGLPDGVAVAVETAAGERILAAGALLPLPSEAGTLKIRLLNAEESSEALRPPQPSTWTWQHQALVTPVEGELIYQILSHASSAAGSGLEASLRLPTDARQIEVKGDDLLRRRISRDGNGNPQLQITWNSRDLLERDLEVNYRVPLRPLDSSWTLEAPVGDGEGAARFIIPSSANMSYSATGMLGPLAAESISSRLARGLEGNTCFVIEGKSAVELQIRRLPVVATDDAVIKEAIWKLVLEDDGAMLAEGVMVVDHVSAQRVTLDTPEGMKLLSCHVTGNAVEPIDLGQGKLEVALPSAGKKASTVLTISFTGKVAALDPLEGMLALSLPQTPLFIRSLNWQISLPPGYRAEVSGNLSRVAGGNDAPGSSIKLRKNLCRDERPQVRVFYQSKNIMP